MDSLESVQVTGGNRSIVAAVRAIGRHGRFGWLLVEGIVDVIAGILAFVLPGLTALVLYVIGAWAIITGIMEIVQAIELRLVIRNEWLLILGGAASVIFGVLLFLFPGAGALAVVWLIDAYAIIFGALLIALSLRLRATHAGTRETMPPRTSDVRSPPRQCAAHPRDHGAAASARGNPHPAINVLPCTTAPRRGAGDHTRLERGGNTHRQPLPSPAGRE